MTHEREMGMLQSALELEGRTDSANTCHTDGVNTLDGGPTMTESEAFRAPKASRWTNDRQEVGTSFTKSSRPVDDAEGKETE